MPILAMVVVTQLWFHTWSPAPVSLAEVARREALRRAALPPSTLTLTNADIGEPPAPPPRPVAADLPAASDAGRETPPGEASNAEASSAEASTDDAHDEGWWRTRMSEARAAVERDRVLIAALESRVASLATDVVNRDDPAQRAQLMADRQRALDELKQLREQVDADVKAIAAIEDEARKAGVPAGWLRGGAEATGA